MASDEDTHVQETEIGTREGERTAMNRELAIRVVSTPRAETVGEPRRLDTKAFSIGRGRECSICLDDPRMSREHGVIESLGDRGLTLRDNESSNGTFLHGTRLAPGQSVPIREGAVIRMGNSLMVVHRAAEAGAPESPEAGLHGCSNAIQNVRKNIRDAAPSTLKVLIEGETGTGKELVAKALHSLNKDSETFVAVNCAGVAASLFESEFFGHVKGAFTGADRDRRGYFAEANGGTLFLDEIGELALEHQAKLLRTLEDARVRPVGATENKTARVYVRIIAATNRPLEAEIQAGRFRRDLLARLEEWPIHIPPLRDRREDVLLIWRHLVNLEKGGKVIQFSPGAKEALLIGEWPSNVRDLRNLAKRLVVQHRSKGACELTTDDLPLLQKLLREARKKTVPDGDDSPLNTPSSAVKRGGTKAELEAALQRTGGNVTRAGELLGVSRETMHRRINEHGIDQKSFRGR